MQTFSSGQAAICRLSFSNSLSIRSSRALVSTRIGCPFLKNLIEQPQIWRSRLTGDFSQNVKLCSSILIVIFIFLLLVNCDRNFLVPAGSMVRSFSFGCLIVKPPKLPPFRGANNSNNGTTPFEDSKCSVAVESKRVFSPPLALAPNVRRARFGRG